MRRFLLSEQPDGAGVVRLAGKDYRYLAKVLRLSAGDAFPARLPSGEPALVRIVSVDSGVLTGFAETRPGGNGGTEAGVAAGPAAAALPPLVLLQALPKGRKMDLIVRQAAEAGISRILPFVSRHSVSRPAEEGPGKIERWTRIVKEARQQSGSGVDTIVEAISDFDGALRYWRAFRRDRPDCVGVLLHQDPLAQGTLHGYLSGNVEAVVLAVGPEGGFSADEATSFLAEEFRPLLLGKNILRTETAALFAAAAVHVLLLEKASWKSNGSPA